MELKLILQIVGFTLGLLYLWLEYRANIYLWLVGLVMPVVHGTLYFQTGLYADFGMNVYYFLASVYGWLVWRNAPKTEKGGGISRTPARRWPMIAAAYAAIHLFIYWVLVTFTNSTVPFWDSLTTSLSIVGMWMLSRKYLEQWFVWFVVNLVTDPAHRIALHDLPDDVAGRVFPLASDDAAADAGLIRERGESRVTLRGARLFRSGFVFPAARLWG